jgi:hypothetical protein
MDNNILGSHEVKTAKEDAFAAVLTALDISFRACD